jgi:hypothetical protein
LVNDATEILGVAEELLLLLDELLPPELDELDDELPHAAIPMVAASTTAAVNGLLFSKCTMSSSSFSP